MKKFLRRQLDRYFGEFTRRRDIDNVYAQIAALLQVQEMLGSARCIGPLRGWALSPDALVIILRDVLSRNSPQIVEFGAGESTIALGSAIRNLGSGHLVTMEHDKDFAASIERRLRSCELLGQAEIRLIPFTDHPSQPGLPAFLSYDLSHQEVEFDVALVDGPISPIHGAGSRSVPLQWCLARLHPGQVIYLDDASRAEERTMIRAVAPAWPGCRFDMIETEKGLLRISCLNPIADGAG